MVNEALDFLALCSVLRMKETLDIICLQKCGIKTRFQFKENKQKGLRFAYN
jgi:hypothetical protein